METLFALLYVLLQIVSPDTESFTMSVMPETEFHGTKQENGIWRIETGVGDAKKYFGDACVDGRILVVKTKEVELPFQAADMLGLAEEVDWNELQSVGRAPLIYKIRRTEDQVEFIPIDDDKIGAKPIITKLQRRKPNKSEQATPRKPSD